MNKYRVVGRFIMALVILCLLYPGCNGDVTVTLAQLAALKMVLQDLESSMSEVTGQVNRAASDRIRQTETAAKETIRRLDESIKKIESGVAVQREELVINAFSIIGRTRSIVTEFELEAFRGINQTLASSAALLDAIPFVMIDDTVFAITPYRMRIDAPVHEVSVYGYFPSIFENANAIEATANGKLVKVKRSAGRIYFDLPTSVLQKTSKIVDVEIRLPKKGWFSKSPTPISTRLAILNEAPYSFSIDVMKSNAAAFATLTGKPHNEYTANNDSPHLEAERLFNLTVSSPEMYDSATARISKVTILSQGGDKACEDCPDPSGRIVGWNGASIDMTLNAPNCNSHWVSKGLFNSYQCGGGGSNYHITIVPTFNVKVKGVQETLPIKTIPLTLKWSRLGSVDLPAEWSSVLIKLKYDDNFDHEETFATLNKDKPIVGGSFFAAKVVNNKLLISTSLVQGASAQWIASAQNASDSFNQLVGITSHETRTHGNILAGAVMVERSTPAPPPTPTMKPKTSPEPALLFDFSESPEKK